MTDVLIVTSMGALTAKYGGSVAGISAAVTQRIARDAAAGTTTVLEDLDQFGPGLDQMAVKNGIDTLFGHHNPDYLVILGAPDVVTHQDLVNPLSPEDPDGLVPSDLPYACDAPYSQRISDFLAPSRVVGRIPDWIGAKDPAYLLKLLDMVTERKDRTQYLDYFGLTAEVWQASTTLNATSTFGSAVGVNVSPPAGAPWNPGILGRASHMINCHGAPSSADFYGQHGTSYPIAISSSDLTTTVTAGTVAAAECCFGAALFDPSVAGGNLPIPNEYLVRGAAAFLGSTTIAYGPPTTNGFADLLCQFWLKSVLSGASVGRALLDARQLYVGMPGPRDPTDLKTLAQFLILGDPAATPVARPAAHLVMNITVSGRAARSARRDEARQRAATLAATTAFASEEVSRALPHDPVIAEAVKAGYSHQAFVVEPPPLRHDMLLAVEEPTIYFHVLWKRFDTPIKGLPDIRGIVATESSGKIVERREFVSR